MGFGRLPLLLVALFGMLLPTGINGISRMNCEMKRYKRTEGFYDTCISLLDYFDNYCGGPLPTSEYGYHKYRRRRRKDIPDYCDIIVQYLVRKCIASLYES